jgi:hypothetical protein
MPIVKRSVHPGIVQDANAVPVVEPHPSARNGRIWDEFRVTLEIDSQIFDRLLQTSVAKTVDIELVDRGRHESREACAEAVLLMPTHYRGDL